METTLMLKQAQARRRQGGFTLIELIAVIIILGILAAVIIPRYADMTTQARNSAAQGAVSEGIARFNMGYAKFIMANSGAAPANMAALTPAYVNATMNLGDYAVGVAGAGGSGTNLVFSAYDNRAGAIAEGGAVAGSAMAPKTVAWP